VRKFKIFYSWQSDREKKCCKDFIRKAADTAATRVSERLRVQVLVEADTEGVAGTPAISETILRKIDECDIFLADMTFVAVSDGGKMLPNPNVMGEYGYALKAKGLDRILLAMNTNFGPPEELPFDLRHLRHPARYTLKEGAADGERRKVRADFTDLLERNITAAIENLLGASPVPDSNPRWDEALDAMNGLINSRFTSISVLVSAPKLMVYVVPLAALEQPPLSAVKVKAARPWFPPSVDVGVKADANENQWWSSDPPRQLPDKPNPEATWSFRLSRPGLFEVSEMIGERIDDDPDIPVYGRDVEQLLVNAVDRVAEVAHRVGLQGPALIGASLEGIEDVEIHRTRPGQGGRRIGRPSAWLGTTRLPSLTAPTAGYLADMMERMWLIGGWDDGSPNFANGHWTGYESK
jgi:hypothetical protein